MRFVGLSKKKMHKRLVAGNSSGRAAVQPAIQAVVRLCGRVAGIATAHLP